MEFSATGLPGRKMLHSRTGGIPFGRHRARTIKDRNVVIAVAKSFNDAQAIDLAPADVGKRRKMEECFSWRQHYVVIARAIKASTWRMNTGSLNRCSTLARHWAREISPTR